MSMSTTQLLSPFNPSSMSPSTTTSSLSSSPSSTPSSSPQQRRRTLTSPSVRRGRFSPTRLFSASSQTSSRSIPLLRRLPSSIDLALTSELHTPPHSIESLCLGMFEPRPIIPVAISSSSSSSSSPSSTSTTSDPCDSFYSSSTSSRSSYTETEDTKERYFRNALIGSDSPDVEIHHGQGDEEGEWLGEVGLGFSLDFGFARGISGGGGFGGVGGMEKGSFVMESIDMVLSS